MAGAPAQRQGAEARSWTLHSSWHSPQESQCPGTQQLQLALPPQHHRAPAGSGEPPATYGGASFPVVTPPCQVAGDLSSCHRDSGPLYRVQAHRPALLSVVRGPSSRSPPTSVDKAGLCLCRVRRRSLAGVLSESGSSRALGPGNASFVTVLFNALMFFDVNFYWNLNS